MFLDKLLYDAFFELQKLKKLNGETKATVKNAEENRQENYEANDQLN